MSTRKFNFNAGPAAMPLAVLEAAAAGLVDYQGMGLSVLEMSHRSPAYGAIIDRARETIAALYEVPDTHEIMFLQGGASLQFAMVPLNLGSGGAYVNTGAWSTKALKEARIVGEGHEVWTSGGDAFRRVPDAGETLEVPAGAPYLHYTSNNTIFGTQWHHLPGGEVPLVADMSSDFLSRPVDVARHDLIYAGAQKNAGPAGVTVLIIRRSISRSYRGAETTANILRYVTHAAKGSMFNTPNTFGIYLVGQVAEWVVAQGGLAAMAERNAARAARLYEAIDAHPTFTGHTDPASRSHMNVTFRAASPEQDAAFISRAAERNIMGIKGHRSVGGLRASIYNAVPDAAIDALIALIADS